MLLNSVLTYCYCIFQQHQHCCFQKNLIRIKDKQLLSPILDGGCSCFRFLQICHHYLFYKKRSGSKYKKLPRNILDSIYSCYHFILEIPPLLLALKIIVTCKINHFPVMSLLLNVPVPIILLKLQHHYLHLKQQQHVRHTVSVSFILLH